MVRPQDIFPRGEGSLLDADTVDGKHARDLISQAAAEITITWDAIQGKPGSFPPAPHSHDDLPKHGSTHLFDDPIFQESIVKALLAAASPSETNPFVTQSGVAKCYRFPAQAEWLVVHNLGRRPLIRCYTEGGVEFEADIIHESDNSARIKMVAPTAGWAVVC